LSKPRLLDLFSGAGGASMGYSQAGFEVVGVDINPQPNYPFEFIQADALTFDISGFDVIHASPPCQAYSRMSVCHPELIGSYPDLVSETRNLLKNTGLPWVIENVPGSPLRVDIKLCGCQFGLRSPRGLGVRRERWFETYPQISLILPPHNHFEPALPVAGHSPGKEWRIRYAEFGEAPRAKERKEAMGVTWMNRNEAAQAIPPAYTEYIGKYLLSCL
jgi:DNA (cytosine-5)-methyltransferase 1